MGPMGVTPPFCTEGGTGVHPHMGLCFPGLNWTNTRGGRGDIPLLKRPYVGGVYPPKNPTSANRAQLSDSDSPEGDLPQANQFSDFGSQEGGPKFALTWGDIPLMLTHARPRLTFTWGRGDSPLHVRRWGEVGPISRPLGSMWRLVRPSWRQGGFMRCQVGTRIALFVPKLAPRWTKLGPRRSKVGPRWPR